MADEYKGPVIPAGKEAYAGDVVLPPELQAPPGMSIDQELADWKKYSGVEHDYPTIASIPFKDIYDKKPGIFATLLTDNPKARQQIALQYLPGSTGGTDRYGRPWIEYKDKRYYMSRPGEIDATDVARGGAAAIATLPAAAAAPASLTGAAIVGGLTAGGLSLGEDYLTRQAGGTEQKIDFGKAGIATIINTILPFGIAKVVMPVAGELNAILRSGRVLSDDVLREIGIDPKILTPDLRARITSKYSETFGNKQAAGGAYRGGLADEFNVAVTKGEISQNADQLAKEKSLSGPADPTAERIMQQFREGQNTQLNTAQEVVRARGSGTVPRSAEEAGSILKRDYRTADQKAKEAVDLLYDKTRNPFLLTEDGIPVAAPGGHVGGVSQVVRSGVEANPKVSNVLTKEGAELAPQAAGALKQLDEFAASTGQRPVPAAGPSGPSIVSSPAARGPRQPGLLDQDLPPGSTSTRWAMDQPPELRIPAQPPSAESLLSSGVNAPPPGGPRITGPNPTGRSNVPGEVDWDRVISQRKLLTDRADAAAAAGNRTDQAAMAEIIKNFDAHFAPLNPNLAAPRAAHAERMSTFKAGGSDKQDRMTEAALDVLQGPEGGAKVANTIFAPSMKKGEATQMIDHLDKTVFKDHPEARDVIREQALRRLLVNQDTGVPLTPRQTVTALQRAFDGDAEAPLYQRLFSGEQLNMLRRFRDLQKAIADGRESPNPSKSGLFLQGILQQGSDKTTGAAIGAAIGAPFGFALEGAGIGGATGRGVGQYIPRIQAQSAVTPRPGYAPPSPQGRVALPPSLLAAQPVTDAVMDNLGPADKIMNDLRFPR